MWHHPITQEQIDWQNVLLSVSAMKIHSKIITMENNLFIMTYRVTPTATTRKTTAKLPVWRNLRTRLDLLKSDTSDKVQQKQDIVKKMKGVDNEQCSNWKDQRKNTDQEQSKHEPLQNQKEDQVTWRSEHLLLTGHTRRALLAAIGKKPGKVRIQLGD